MRLKAMEQISDSVRMKTEDLKVLLEDILNLSSKADQIEQMAKDATGEMYIQYSAVHRDMRWKIQTRIGKLWFYVCGAKDMSPFLDKKVEKPEDGLGPVQSVSGTREELAEFVEKMSSAK